jgi:hypothetical protein
MKAKVYRLDICDGVMDQIHGNGRKICEIFIPELNIAFNIEACFEIAYEDRYKGAHARCVEEIDVPDEIVRNLKSYINAKKRLQKSEKWFEEQDFKKKFDKYQKRKFLKMVNQFSLD